MSTAVLDVRPLPARLPALLRAAAVLCQGGLARIIHTQWGKRCSSAA